MKNINEVRLLGNLGQNPELRHTQAGTSVLNLRLATSNRFRDQTGSWQERTEWHSVVVWGSLAEFLETRVQKGQPLYVEGQLAANSYEKDGLKRYTTEIKASTVIPLAQPPRREEESEG